MPRKANTSSSGKLAGERQPLLGRQDTAATIGSSTIKSENVEDENGIPALPIPPVLGTQAVKPNDLTTALVKKIGSKKYDWSLVNSVAAVPFSTAGLSEATMYHGIIGSNRPSVPSEPGDGELTNPNAANNTLGSPTTRTSSVGSSRSSFRGILKKTFSTVGSNAGGGSSLASPRGCYHSGELTVLAPPPSVCVIKHYESSTVESKSMVIRAARFMLDITCESMARHEVFFYTKVAPILSHDREILNQQYRDTVRDDPELEALSRGLRGNRPKPQDTFHFAELYFATHKDKGEPGLLRYVCCGSGTGSSTTLAMADLNHLGFSFSHSSDDGLYDASSIRAALIAMASFHSSMWGRFEIKQKDKASDASVVSAAQPPPVTPKAGVSPPIQDFPDFTPTNTSDLLQHSSIVVGDSTATPSPPMRGKGSPQFLLNPPPSGGGVEDSSPGGGSSGKLSGGGVEHPSAAIIKDPPPASISRALHRLGKKTVERANHNNDLTVCIPSLVELFRRWDEYWPILGVPEVQRALRKVHKNWHSIRAKTAKIVLRAQTILHGDFHHKNIGFRRVNSKMSSSRREKWTTTHSEAQRQRSEVVGVNMENAQDLHASPTAGGRQHSQGGGGVASPPPAGGITQSPELECCAIDYQGCGTGSVAHELIYFICSSLPVDIFVESSLGTKQSTRLSGGGGGGGTKIQGLATGDGIDGDWPNPITGGGAFTGSLGVGSNTSGSKKLKRAERAKKEHQFTLTECRELDNAIIREYYTNLSAGVKAQYSLHQLVEDVHILTQHWAGCLLMDLSGTPEGRDKMKRGSSSPGGQANDMKELIEWSEKTATRVMWTVTSILTSAKGRVSTGSSVESCVSAGASFDSAGGGAGVGRGGGANNMASTHSSNPYPPAHLNNSSLSAPPNLTGSGNNPVILNSTNSGGGSFAGGGTGHAGHSPPLSAQHPPRSGNSPELDPYHLSGTSFGSKPFHV